MGPNNQRNKTFPQICSSQPLKTESFCRLLSISESHEEKICLEEPEDEHVEEVDDIAFSIGNFISCIYANNFWFGVIENQSEEFGDYYIKVMHPPGQSSEFKWPKNKDKCWVPKENMLCIIQCPSITSSSTRGYCVKDEDLKTAARLWRLCRLNRLQFSDF